MYITRKFVVSFIIFFLNLKVETNIFSKLINCKLFNSYFVSNLIDFDFFILRLIIFSQKYVLTDFYSEVNRFFLQNVLTDFFILEIKISCKENFQMNKTLIKNFSQVLNY